MIYKNGIQFITILITCIVFIGSAISSFYLIQASAKDDLQNFKLKVTENYITKEEFNERLKKLDVIEIKINYIDKKLNMLFVKMQIKLPDEEKNGYNF